jgi:rhamnose transport system ATP-binding protein
MGGEDPEAPPVMNASAMPGSSAENDALVLNGVSKSFGAVRALKNVSFSLRYGEVHAIVGENGAGKSTLIKIITGAHSPDSGTISINGRMRPRLHPRMAHAAGIACIYQQPALFSELSVAENVALGLEPPNAWRKIDWKARRETAGALLKRLGTGIDPESEVRMLSMPEQQLVEIARALGAGARILIMDEPSASLSETEARRLHGIVRDLREHGAGVVYISHRLDEVFALADRITILRDGESVGTTEREKIEQRTVVERMVGRAIASIHPPSQNASGEIILRAHGLCAKHARVRGVDLELRAGEVLGLAGLMGAGRTEVAQILFGLVPATAGSIEIDGKVVVINSPREAIALGIAYLPEDRIRHGVILPLPIAVNMTMAMQRQLFPGGWIREKLERTRALEFMRTLAIKAAGPDAPVKTLSGGNQQKVALARWLMCKPRILILDEPTQGVDVGAKAEIHRIIRELTRDGMAVLMISSDLPELLGMSDRIVVVCGGRSVAAFAARPPADDVMAAAVGHVENLGK